MRFQFPEMWPLFLLSYRRSPRSPIPTPSAARPVSLNIPAKRHVAATLAAAEKFSAPKKGDSASDPGKSTLILNIFKAKKFTRKISQHILNLLTNLLNATIFLPLRKRTISYVSLVALIVFFISKTALLMCSTTPVLLSCLRSRAEMRESRAWKVSRKHFVYVPSCNLKAWTMFWWDSPDYSER